ncbi:ABC transporter ATP-binding protein [Cellulomonas sp. H30R-01]|uniref:ABC transporter ATP-binding protein n=1 Tax=Cellulomonas sp. H30R-01 TaxID=2704467 RepID=UPI00138D8CA6|nr:ABC transporter ATP-binding protein [Cellulomonas sp. H30R-01]
MSGLRVQDVVVRYPAGRRGWTTAVDGVSLDVGAGEVVALLGPSGCGKSSLLRAVAGLEPLAGGSVAFDGKPVDGLPVHRRGFGLMFQDGQLFAHRDVAGNVAYGLAGRRPEGRGAGPGSDDGRTWAAGGRAALVDELLDLVGLAGYGPRPVATLSGGERQRVALARALAPRPRLLLLDEPLSALDRSLRERLAVDLRAALVATRTTAVLVTHDQDEAFAVADRVAVMDRGRVLQVGTPADLWQRPADRRVAEFLGYEAFVPVTAAVAAPLVRALAHRGEVGAVPRAADGGGATPAPRDRDVVALAEGAFVVERVPSPGVVGAIGEDGVKGVVLAVTSRRGRSEVRVDVDGIGPVTALAPVGVQLDPGSVVPLAVDPDALAVLPLDAPG